jgi:Uma2 family endonuclease
MAVETTQRLFTVREYHRMVDAGILAEDDRVELLEGKIIRMRPIRSRHAACVLRLNTVLNQQAAGTALVNVQNPIQLDEYSEPEPDIALLRPRTDFYRHAHPTPADVLLVVEVADTTDVSDRTTKIPMYARAGIVEVWLVRLGKGVIEVYTDPTNGQYRTLRQLVSGQRLTALYIPSITIDVTTLFD